MIKYFAFAALPVLLLTATLSAAPLAIPRYALQAVDRDNLSDATLSRAEGLSIRVTWAALEPQDNTFDVTFLNQQIARAKRAGKKVQLRILAGNDSPKWLPTKGARYVASGNMPKPWDPVYQAQLGELLAHVSRMIDQSAITHVHMPGANSSEWHFAAHSSLYSEPDYSDARMVQSVTIAADMMARVFPRAVVVANLGDHNRTWTGQAIATLKMRYRGRIGFQINSLKASTPLTYIGYVRIKLAAAEGHHAGFQMIGPSINQRRFGGPLDEALLKAQAAGAQWLEIYGPDL